MNRLILTRCVAFGAILVAACARTLPGDPPPASAFYFPVGIGVSPDERYAYIANSNFDLRYSAGWVSLVDLDAAIAGASMSEVVLSQVKILSLAGGISLSPSGAMATIAHRGAATLSLLEIGADGRTASCGDAGATTSLSNEEKYTDCDRAHMLPTLCTAPQLDSDKRPSSCPWEEGGVRRVFPEELYEEELSDPFATLLFTHTPAAGGQEALLAVSHLTPGDTSSSQSNRLLLFRVDTGSNAGEAITLSPLKSIALGFAGISSLAIRPDGTGSFLAAATQQYDSSISEASTIYAIDVEKTLTENKDRYAGHSVNSEAGGASIAGLAFAEPNGNLAYVNNRSPDSVVVMDTSLEDSRERDSSGVVQMVRRPRFHVLGATVLPKRPASLLQVKRQSGEDLLAIASFTDDAVFLMSIEGESLRLTGRLDVPGNGPFALAHVTRGTRDYLLVITFFSHALLIYDVTGAEASRFPLVAELHSSETPAADPAR